MIEEFDALKTTEVVDVVSPYGGCLVDLLVLDELERQELITEANRLPSIQLSPCFVCDLELLAVGGFRHWIVL